MATQAQVSWDDNGSAVVATVEAADMTPDILEALMGRVRELSDASRPALLVVDMARVKFVDSVGLGSLVVLLRRVKETQGRLALTGLGGHSRNVLQVTGLDKVFELYDDAPSALEGFDKPA